jgi:branched-chain amino acid aminotransferase
MITAPLDGKIILDGVTRRSVLELARERLVLDSKYLNSEIQGLEVVERMFSMLEVVEAQKEGRLIEAFVSGTAVRISYSFNRSTLTIFSTLSRLYQL